MPIMSGGQQAGSGSLKIQLDAIDMTAGPFGTASARIDKLASQIEEFKQRTTAYNQAMTDANSKVEGGMASMGVMVKGLAAGLAIVTGAAIAFGQAMKFASEGADLQRIEQSSKDLAKHYGENMDEMLGKLREFSQGAVSDTDLMLATNRAMMLGVSTDADDLGNLLQVAALRGRAMGEDTTKAFNDIVTGIGRMSPRILDNLGIVIDADKAYAEYAATIGKTSEQITDQEKRSALLYKVLQEGNQMLKDAGGLAEDNATSFERWEASWANFTEQVKITAAPAGAAIADAATTALKGWQELFTYLQSRSEIDAIAEKMMRGQNMYKTEAGGSMGQGMVTTYDYEKEAAIWEEARQFWVEHNRVINEGSNGVKYYRDVSKEASESVTAGNAEIVASYYDINNSITDINLGEKDQFDIITDLQKVEDTYSETLGEIALKREDINTKLAEHKISAEEATAAELKLGEAEKAALDTAMAASEKMVFNLLSQKMAADGNYAGIIKLGEAWGFIDPTVAKAGESMLNILNNENLTISQQEQALRGVATTMLNNAEVTTTAGPKFAQGMGPVNAALDTAQDKAASLAEDIWVLNKQQGTYNYEFNIKVNGALPRFGPIVSIGGANNPNCFIGGTMVMLASGKRKAIETIKIGDEVMSMDLDHNRLEHAVVKQVWRHPANNMNGYLLINGNLGVTPEHLVYVNGKWKGAHTIQTGDLLVGLDGSNVKVSSIRWTPRRVVVYNLHTSKSSHNYFAEDILVHNGKLSGESNIIGTGFAAGGQMSSNSWSRVGEQGYEFVSPTGYVFSHRESVALEQAGLVPGRAFRIGGDMTEEERKYYEDKPLGDIEDRLPRNTPSPTPVTTTRTPPSTQQVITQTVTAVTALATQTSVVATSVAMAAQQQVQEQRASTAALTAQGDETNAELKEIRRLLARLPDARDQVQLSRSGAAQAV